MLSCMNSSKSGFPSSVIAYALCWIAIDEDFGYFDIILLTFFPRAIWVGSILM